MRHVADTSLFVLLTAAVVVAACTWMTEAPPAGVPLAVAPAERAPALAEQEPPPPDAGAGQVDFASQILPIVRRCQPCHFEGGKMYAALPFDDPATLRRLGERLFTRIKDADEQALLRAFLAQPPAES